jgi:hypothetical protein
MFLVTILGFNMAAFALIDISPMASAGLWIACGAHFFDCIFTNCQKSDA